MLGGNVIIAMIRYVISVAGVILLFSQMSQFRFDRKKTVIGYALFTVVLVSGACVCPCCSFYHVYVFQHFFYFHEQ